MSFLVVLCEGETEMAFTQETLASHLAHVGVVTHQILLGKKLKHDAPGAPGGVLKYDPVYRHIKAALRQYSSETSYVTTLMDLYAFPRDFPAYAECAAIKNPHDRVKAFERVLSDNVGDPRFIPHIQLHEFEALVLSNLDALKAEFDEADVADRIEQLSRDIGGLAPEEIDQTREGAPSKRLIRFLPRYNKRVMGPRIAARVGLPSLRKACPHLEEWIQRLESLGTSG